MPVTVSWQTVSGTLVSVGLLYFILTQLLRRRKKADIRGKVVLITGASSGLGEGENIFLLQRRKLDQNEN